MDENVAPAANVVPMTVEKKAADEPPPPPPSTKELKVAPGKRPRGRPRKNILDSPISNALVLAIYFLFLISYRTGWLGSVFVVGFHGCPPRALC